jgi:hypothetical protein
MARKVKSEKNDTVQGWKGLHHRFYLSPNDEAEFSTWVRGNADQLHERYLECFEKGWSIKISPDSRNNGYYVTIQDKTPDCEFGDHSIGLSWSHIKGSIALAVYAIHVLSERGDLWRDIASSSRDLLDFLK